MQEWFNIRHSINAVHYINRLKKKNHICYINKCQKVFFYNIQAEILKKSLKTEGDCFSYVKKELEINNKIHTES